MEDVAQGDVHQPIAACERNRGFGTMHCQGSHRMLLGGSTCKANKIANYQYEHVLRYELESLGTLMVVLARNPRQLSKRTSVIFHTLEQTRRFHSREHV